MKAGTWFLVLLLLAATGGGAWYVYGRPHGPRYEDAQIKWAKVERGAVVEGVAASGAIQPLLLVQVGTQVSGVIDKLLKDFNDPVQEGETIALLDDRRLRAQLTQDEASLSRTRADLMRVKAEQARADRELARQQSLALEGLTSASDLDAAVTAAESAKAQVLVSEAAVKQSEATLEIDKVNLGYATIKSPINGVVVTRSVDVGQTVAASLSAPIIFTIANDLTQMRVEVSVPEADIGRIKKDQVVRFTVDAYPDKIFPGKVREVRLSGTTVSNVVTYVVVVDAENKESLLLPGMTANAIFEVAKSNDDSLKVPSAALRVKVPDEMIEGKKPAGEGEGTSTALAQEPSAGGVRGGVSPPRDEPSGGGTATASSSEGAPRKWRRREGGGEVAQGEAGARAEGGPRGEGAGGGSRGEGRGGREGKRSGPPQRGTVYIQGAEGKLKAVPVRIGITDGAFTVVRPFPADALAEGVEVATSVIVPDDSTDSPEAASNPFGPPQFRGRGGGRGR